MWEAIHHEDLVRLRFALLHGQEVSVACYDALIEEADPTLLNEVLLARKVGDTFPEGDRGRIKEALRRFKRRECVTKVLADHSIVV